MAISHVSPRENAPIKFSEWRRVSFPWCSHTHRICNVYHLKSFCFDIGVIAVVGIGGGAYYYFKFVRGKKKKDEDLDFFDDDGYEEEPYINEDEEPDIAEDDETQDEE